MQETRSLRMERTVPIHYLIDAHCHLDLFDNPELVIRESVSKGVGMIITAGGNSLSNNKTVKIAENERVFAVIGIDPQFVEADFSDIDSLEKLIMSSRKIVGIGEIGLDFKIDGIASFERQEEAFIKQLDIAKKLHLPVVIHSRNSMERVMEIVNEKKVAKALFHFFEGSVEQAKLLAEKGYLISIPPVESSKRKRVIKELDLSSIVAETDSPVVGKSPADVSRVIELVAKIKGIGFEEAAQKITENVKEFFYI